MVILLEEKKAKHEWQSCFWWDYRWFCFTSLQSSVLRNILQCVQSTLISRGRGLRNRKECPEVYLSLLEFESKKQNLSLLTQVSWWSRKTQKLAKEAGSLPLPLPRGHSPLRIFVSLSRCCLGMSPNLPPTVLSLRLAKVVNLSCVCLSLSCLPSSGLGAPWAEEAVPAVIPCAPTEPSLEISFQYLTPHYSPL